MEQAHISVSVSVDDHSVDLVLSDIDENVRMELQALIKKGILSFTEHTVDTIHFYEIGKTFLNKKVTNWAVLNRVHNPLTVKMPIKGNLEQVMTVTITPHYGS